MTLEQILAGIQDAESNLSTREAIVSPAIISTHMYRLGQYASALEKVLGDCEEEYEITWAKSYNTHSETLSATAAKQKADVDCAIDKGNIKRLTRYVSSSWRNQTGAMARINHIYAESKNGGV